MSLGSGAQNQSRSHVPIVTTAGYFGSSIGAVPEALLQDVISSAALPSSATHSTMNGELERAACVRVGVRERMGKALCVCARVWVRGRVIRYIKGRMGGRKLS